MPPSATEVSDASSCSEKVTPSPVPCTDYVGKNGFPGIILGLSGGIDSALTAAVAVDALGAERVHCVLMPSRYTSQGSLDDAAALAAGLGVRFDTISIEPAVGAFGDMLSEVFAGQAPDTTEENVQARARAVILMAISNKFGYMLLTTGNKSEMSVGYATLMFGFFPGCKAGSAFLMGRD